LGLRQARDFEALVKPLSTGGRKPNRQDLSSFWERVETGVCGLGYRLADLRAEHIRRLTPFILGEYV
jgi:hypothetical protein